MKKNGFAPEEKQILTATCFGHFMSHFNMLVFPALVLPLAARMDISLSEALSLSLWQYLLYGLTALPWGYLADRIGPRPLLILQFTGSGLCALAAAFNADDPSSFSLSLAGIGLFAAIYHPAGLGLISKGIERVTMALGYNGMAGILGVAMAPLLTGFINYLAGPVAAYVFLGCLNLAGIYFLVRLGPVKNTVSGGGGQAKGNNRNLLTAFCIMLVAMMLGGFAYRGATVFMPTLLELNAPAINEWINSWWIGGATANVTATTVTSLIYLTAVFAQYMGGRIGEKVDPRWGYLAFHAIGLPAALLMGWATNWTLAGLGMWYLFFLLGMQPLENTLVTRLTPARLRHSAFGMKFVLTFGVGSLSVVLVGAISKYISVGAVFPFLGLISLGIVITVAILIRRTREITLR